MRKIIFSINTSLDGYYEGPHKELDWSIADAELHDFYSDLLGGADLLIFGRVVYQMMLDYWPNAPSDPDATPSEKRFANTLNPKPKLVYSKTLRQVGWNTQLRNTFNPQEILGLKSQPGSYILVSSAAMARVFFSHGLVDEYMPMIHPVVIGSGNAVFAGMTTLPRLETLESHRLASGAVSMRYSVQAYAA
jgi:dihydrofolate reductase